MRRQLLRAYVRICAPHSQTGVSGTVAQFVRLTVQYFVHIYHYR
jgi:hypothetical protein